MNISQLLNAFSGQALEAAKRAISDDVPKFVQELKENLQAHLLLRAVVQSQATVEGAAKVLQHAQQQLDADDPGVSEAEVCHAHAVGLHGELLDEMVKFLKAAHVPYGLLDAAQSPLPGIELPPALADHDCPNGCVPRCSPCPHLDGAASSDPRSDAAGSVVVP